jgi:hypothetical protein
MESIDKFIEQLNTVNVEVSFSRKDFRKFFFLAVLANVISSTALMGTIGYLARSDKEKKKIEENKENNG